jgi:hypothetical protein
MYTKNMVLGTLLIKLIIMIINVDKNQKISNHKLSLLHLNTKQVSARDTNRSSQYLNIM